MKKVCVGGTNLEIIAEASLFQIQIYLATETYNIGDPRWLLYSPKPVSVLSNRNLQEYLADNPFSTHTLIILYHANIETSLHDAFTTHTHTDIPMSSLKLCLV